MTLLAPRDAAKMLGVSTSRVIQLAREGRLPELRDSARRRLFKIDDVQRLVDIRRGVVQEPIAIPTGTSTKTVLYSDERWMELLAIESAFLAGKLAD